MTLTTPTTLASQYTTPNLNDSPGSATSAPTTSTRTLSAEQIPNADKNGVSQIAAHWKIIAQEKAMLATNETEKQQFLTCAKASNVFEVALQDLIEYRKFYMCKDEHGTVQAMMMLAVQRSLLSIEWLVTHPKNIQSSVNDAESNKVRGAGTCLLTLTL